MIGLCPEMREIWHFGQKTIMAGWSGQVAARMVVMPGPDPGIHPLRNGWIAGSSPAMTGTLPSNVAKPRRLIMSEPLQIGLVLFPKVTQLDFTAPLQVFSSVPGAKVHLIWKRIEPVPSDSVLALTPTITFADCPQLDVICVPGGSGTDDMIGDEEMLAFLRKQAIGAKYVTSVCTGSLVLGAAGLLQGYRAATHWTAMDFLKEFGATPAKTRVCVDRNRVTGGGVTAGIDFALTLVSIMVDRPTAEAIQLRLEYNPAPPFNSGSPDTAPPEVLASMKDKIAASQQRRGELIARAAALLG
jgi:cyclohexyl-isocyanide hydratase